MPIICLLIAGPILAAVNPFHGCVAIGVAMYAIGLIATVYVFAIVTLIAELSKLSSKND